jgi:hypothetical protein
MIEGIKEVIWLPLNAENQGRGNQRSDLVTVEAEKSW